VVECKKYNDIVFTFKDGNIIKDTNDPAMVTDTYDNNIESTGVDKNRIFSNENNVTI